MKTKLSIPVGINTEGTGEDRVFWLLSLGQGLVILSG